MTEITLSLEEKEFVDETVDKLTTKQTTLLALAEAMKDELTSTNAQARERGINKLVGTILRLPRDFLTNDEVDLLLRFLLPRVEDSGHVADSLITGIHYLILDLKRPLSDDLLHFALMSLFESNGTQGYGQKDRTRLYELLDFFVFQHNNLVQSLGSQFMVMFMAAATGERDPRCLIKVFRMFPTVVRNLTLGPFAEDMFEMVACYYPIEYQPNENDSAEVTTEMLVAGCESCLLAHGSFSIYCFQLVAEKLLDEEVPTAQRIDVWRFLAKACSTFPSPQIRTYLDDYLTAFRLLCLNPNLSPKDDSALRAISEAFPAMIRALTGMGEDTSELDLVARTMLENCEPFVLQAEMGLSARALNLLECLARSDGVLAGEVVPKVLYWINALLTGMTIKNPANRKEIVEEVVQLVPNWIQLARDMDQVPALESNLPALFASMTAAEPIAESAVRRVQYECATLCMDATPSNAALENQTQKLLERVVAPDHHADGKRSELRISALKFLRKLATSRWDVCWSFIEKELLSENGQNWREEHFELIAYAVHDQDSLLAIWPVAEKKIEQNGIAKRSAAFFTDMFLLNTAADAEFTTLAVDRFIGFLDAQIKKRLQVEEQRTLAECLQDVGVALSPGGHSKLTAAMLLRTKSREYGPEEKLAVLRISHLLALQAEPPAIDWFLRVSLSVSLGDEFTGVALALFFALVNKSVSQRATELQDLRMQVERIAKGKVAVAEAKALMLAGRPEGLQMVEKLFADFTALDDVKAVQRSGIDLLDLLDFESRTSDPERCRAKCTLMWRQRFFCQFVPLFVRVFGDVPKEEREKRSVLLRFVEPLLRLAQKIPVPMTRELCALLPIFTEALPVAVGELNDDAGANFSVLIEGTAQLLRLVPTTELSDATLDVLIRCFQQVLKQQTSMATMLNALECLELLAKRVDKKRLSRFYASTVEALSHASASKKRLVRLKAANVRNHWELSNE